MAISDMKWEPCTKCSGPAPVQGSGAPRQIFYMTDRLEIRCKACGDVVTLMKPGQAQ
jgi:hypothetical protein